MTIMSICNLGMMNFHAYEYWNLFATVRANVLQAFIGLCTGNNKPHHRNHMESTLNSIAVSHAPDLEKYIKGNLIIYVTADG